MPIPSVETDRLILRPHRLEDFAVVRAMSADPDVMRYMGSGATQTEEDAWSKFLRFAGYWHYLGYGYWAVEEKISGRMIGDVGFSEKKRDRGPEFCDVPEMGWALSPSAQGKGYATEAVNGAIGWGRESLGNIRVICLINADNAASIAVARKCGFREAANILSAGRPRLVFDRVL